VGDRDGVVAVPLAQAPAVAQQLALVRRKETDAEKKLARGEDFAFWDPAALKGRVRYVD
jgi:regulator of RNase E activity RraA